MSNTYIIDENLPPDLAQQLRVAGIDAYHINEMKAHRAHRIRDDQIRRASLRKGYIIITKDDDFIKSFVSRKVPEKMIYIYGLQSRSDLLQRMTKLMSNFEQWMTEHDFIEINEKEVKFPFSD